MECAVRLVRSARPSRKIQDNMIEYIVAYMNISKDELMEALNK